MRIPLIILCLAALGACSNPAAQPIGRAVGTVAGAVLGVPGAAIGAVGSAVGAVANAEAAEQQRLEDEAPVADAENAQPTE